MPLSPNTLASKLEKYVFVGWVRDWLDVCIQGVKRQQFSVQTETSNKCCLSWVHTGSNTIQYFHEWSATECIPSKFADDTLEENGCHTQGQHKKHVHLNLTMFNSSCTWVRAISNTCTDLRTNWLRAALQTWGQRLMKNRIWTSNVHLQPRKSVMHTSLSAFKEVITSSTLREFTVSLFFDLLRPHLNTTPRFGNPSTRCRAVKEVQRRAMKMVRALEHLLYRRLAAIHGCSASRRL